MNYTVHEIFQARIMELVAFPFCRRSSQPSDQTQVSHIAAEPQGKPYLLLSDFKEIIFLAAPHNM